MKSVCTPETFTPRSSQASGAAGSPSTSGMPEPNAMWQVAFSSNSVSQKTRPVSLTGEDPSTRATSPRIAGLVVGSELLADDVRSARGVHLDDAPGLEPHLELGDGRARGDERLRRANAPLRAAPVRAREDLFGRDVRDVLDPGGCLERAESQRAPGMRPIVSSVPGTAEPNRVEAVGVQAVRPSLQSRRMCTPRADEVRLVQPSRTRDCLPERFDIRLPEHLSRPARIGRGQNRPVHGPSRDALEHGRAKLFRLGSADERRVEVAQEAGIGIPGQGDERGLLVVPTPHPVEHVRRRPAELLLRPQLDRRAALVQIRVEDDDVSRACAIGLAHDLTPDLGVLDQAPNDDVLARLHVRPYANRELRVPPEALLRCHKASRLCVKGA